MHITTEGIIFRQTKAAGGRKMLLLFTAKNGKISVGTSMETGGKRKSSLALRPFTYGSYQIYQGRNYYNLDRADTIKSFYNLGEDLDKYMAASYVMELTEKVVPEELPQPAVFQLLIEFLAELSERKKSYITLILAYEIRLLKILGMAPVTDRCVLCGEQEGPARFSIPDGGMICESCYQKKARGQEVPLIYKPKFGIVEVVNYFASKSLKSFRQIALQEDVAGELQGILRQYFAYYLDVKDMKSEQIFNDRY